MPGLPAARAVSPVPQRPMRNTDADQRGRGGLINHDGPTAMDVDAGTVGRGLVSASLRGRRPLDRWAACGAHPATDWLLGRPRPPHALPDDAVGRRLDRLDDLGPMQLCTAWAVRVAARLGMERRDGHLDTTCRRGWGEEQGAAEQDLAGPVTYGDRQDTRPALQPCGFATRGVDRAVPLWGQPAAGTASATPRNPPR